MNQLSFADLLVPKESKPPSVWERMAAGLKSQRMGAVDREEHLRRQIDQLNERRRDEHECSGQCAGKDDQKARARPLVGPLG